MNFGAAGISWGEKAASPIWLRTVFAVLRMKDGAIDVTDGPYAETKEALGGILLLEARDLNHAIVDVATPGSEDGAIRDPACE